MRTRTLLLLIAAIVLLLPALSGHATPPPVHAAPPLHEFVLGMSAQGRPIHVVQVGDGERKLVVVGDTHGGPEANTYHLTLQLIDHFRTTPGAVPAGVRLYLIPTINPDGLALDSRFNAAGVDLNRNMNTGMDSCTENDWSPTVYGAYGIISDTGGAYADSEVESRLLRGFLLDASGAIFLHSNAGLVFPAFCEHAPSIAMAQTYAAAAGYEYHRVWERYIIQGGMHDWAGSLGIAAITPELISPTESEFAQNLAGLQAVLQDAEELLPLPADGVVGGFVVPATIWRYWRALGGAAVFGLPLEPARTTDYGVVQTFSNARLELRSANADTPEPVQPAPLLPAQRSTVLSSTVTLSGTATLSGTSAPSDERYPIAGAFLDYWQRNSGEYILGDALSPALQAPAADGTRRTVQYFERGVLALSPEDGSVQPEPVGWQRMLLEQVQAHQVVPQVR
jgi:predicted deacylase